LSESPLGPDTATLAIHLLGGLQIRREGRLLPHPFPTRKSASLFAFLLLHDSRDFTRGSLAGTFWPDVEEQAGRGSLGAALLPIRKLMELQPEEDGRYLVSSGTLLRLIPPPACWVDVWAFDQAVAEAERASRGSREWFEALEKSARLYSSDLLPHLGDHWCLRRREELQTRFLTCLRDLTQVERERHQYAQASTWARRALQVDPCDEESHRHLMLLYVLQGEHARAMHQYHQCRRVLRKELDVAPDEETIALYERLRAPRSRKRWMSSRWEITLRGLTGPLVGRDQEQERLHAAWERARSGRRELILLTGEAGTGKSRLGRQLLQSVALSDGLALYGQASAPERSLPYRPLIAPLRRALELAEQKRLTLCAPVWLAHVARLLPELPQGEASLAMPEGESARLVEEGIAQLLLSLSTQRAVCLFLDDLQWADAATGRFLHFLARQSRQTRILLIGAYRDGEVADSDWLGQWLTEIEAQRMATSLTLARLNGEEAHRLLAQVAEDQAPDALLRSLGKRLYEESEGNPLFLLETLRDLFEREYLMVNEEGQWRIAPEPLAPSGMAAGAREGARGELVACRLPLSETVQQVVRQRVSRLQEEDRTLLQCAAVIGRQFTLETLGRAAGRELEPTLEGVERLLAADLIRTTVLPASFEFSHCKIREVVYEDLLTARRQELL
jgi:DNA-binding SARP family transcriptional activator